MAADNSTRLIITAEDKASAAISGVNRSLAGLSASANQFASSFSAALLPLATATTLFAGLKSSLDFGSKLHDMAMQTGATVEQLSALRNVSEMSGVSLDEAGKGLQRLSRNMLEAATGNKEAAATFAALGVSIKDSQGRMRESGDVMKDVAGAIASLASPTERVAAAQLAFGKSGAALVPMLMDIASGAELVATWTAKDAAAADEFGDNLAKLGQHARGTAEALTRDLLPALVQLSGKLEASFKDGIVEGFTSRWGAAFKSLAAGINEAMATAEMFLGKITFGRVSENHYKQAAQFRAAAGSLYSEIAKLDAPVQSVARKVEANASAVKNLAEAAKPAKKEVDELAAVLNKLNSQNAGLDANYWKELQTLAAGYKAGRIDVDQYRDAVTKLTTAQKFHQDALKQEHEAQKAWADAADKAAKAAEGVLATLEDRAKAAEEELENYGKLKSEIEDTVILRLEERRAMEWALDSQTEVVAALDREIAARRRARDAFKNLEAAEAATEAAKETARVWKEFSADIERALTDSLMRGFEAGKDFGDAFVDSLTASLKTMFAKALVAEMVTLGKTALAGAAASAMGESAGANVGTWLNAGSSASSLYQMYSGFTTGTGTGLAGSAGNYLGGLAGMTSQTTGFAYMSSAEVSAMFSTAASEAALVGADAAATAYTAAAVEAGSTVAAAEGAAGTAASMGPYGWIAAAVILAAAYFAGQGGGPKTEGDALMRLTAGRPEYGGSEGYFTGHSADEAAKVFADVAATSIGAAIKDLGGSAAGLGVLLGFNTDPMGDAPDNVTGAVFDRSGGLAYQRTTDTGRGNYANALAEEVQRMLLAAIKASDVAAAYRMIAGSIDLMTASAEQLSQAMTDIGNMQQVLEYGKSDPFKAYAESIEAAGNSLTLQIEHQREQVMALAGAFDGSTAAVNGLLESTRARYQIEMQLAQQVAEGLKATDAMFADSIRSVRLSVLDNQGKYDFFDKEAARYRDVLATLTDPQMIGEYAKKLNDSIMSAWGILDETQKSGTSEKFIGLLDQADALAQTRYAAVEQAARDDRQALASAIESAIDAAMQRAADKIAASAAVPKSVSLDVSVNGVAAATEVVAI